VYQQLFNLMVLMEAPAQEVLGLLIERGTSGDWFFILFCKTFTACCC